MKAAQVTAVALQACRFRICGAALTATVLLGACSEAELPLAPEATVPLKALASSHAAGVHDPECPLGIVTVEDGPTRTVTLTFEGVQDRTTINADGGYLYPCTRVRFNDNWRGLTDQGAYSNNPSGVAVAAWLFGNGEFTLDAPVSAISLHYASRLPVRLEAYAGSKLVAAADAPATGGFRTWSTVSVDHNAITRVRLIGRARFVVIDDLAYTARGRDPEGHGPGQPGRPLPDQPGGP